MRVKEILHTLEEYFEKALPEVDRKLPLATLLVQ